MTFIKARLYVIIFFVVALGTISDNTRAQDPVYSQFHSAPLQLNPAFTGNVERGLISFNHRNQWPRFSKAYRTYSASYSRFFKDLNSGVGISLLTDDAGNGLYKTTFARLYYSYLLRINRDLNIKGGIEFGYGQNVIDWDRLTFFDQIDPQFGLISPGGLPYPTEELQPTNERVGYVDIGTGFLIYNETFFAGVSARHLNRPDNNFLVEGNEGNTSENIQGLPIRWSVHGGAEFHFGPQIRGREPVYTLAPYVLFTKQKEFTQINAGAVAFYKSFGLGASYRHSGSNPDAVIGQLILRFDAYRFGYSYDSTISELSGFTGGAHEVSFNINLDILTGKPDGPDYNDCFGLFR